MKPFTKAQTAKFNKVTKGFTREQKARLKRDISKFASKLRAEGLTKKNASKKKALKIVSEVVAPVYGRKIVNEFYSILKSNLK